MSRSIFGWDLPPGCTVGDIERAFGDGDDSCCAFCQSPLSDNPKDDSWEFQGVCDAICAMEYGWLLLDRYKSQDLHQSVYSDFERAMREIIERAAQYGNEHMI